MEDIKEVDGISHSFVPFASAVRTFSLRFREKENLADSLQAQFQPVDQLSIPAVIEMLNELKRIRVCPRK
jgi:hypothetical protein